MQPETEFVAGRTRLRIQSQSFVGLILIALPLFFYFVLVFVSPDVLIPRYIEIALIGLIGAGISLILMQYLQTGLVRVGTRGVSVKFVHDLERQSKERSTHVEEALQSFRKELREVQSRELSLDETDLAAARETLKSILEDATAQEVLAKIEEKVASENRQNTAASELEDALRGTLNRLGTEVAALGRRGNLNLVLGILTTVVGLFVLAYAVFGATELTQDPALIASYYLPRLSLVLLIELFAYFFLNLYKTSLIEIKYFQNEMTNVEAKYTSLHFALMLRDSKTTSEVLTTLAATERNFTLKKGETTVELQRSKIDSDSLKSLSKSLSDLLGGSNKNSKP